MNRKLFYSLVLLGVLFAIVSMGGYALFRISPSQIPGDVAGVWLQRGDVGLRISGHDLVCDNSELLVKESQCSVLVDNKTLSLVVHFGSSEKRSLRGCEAFYGGVYVSCEAGFDYAGQGGSKVFLTVRELDISAARLVELRQQDVMGQFSEAVWVRYSLAVSGLLTGVLLLCMWFAKNGRSVQTKFIVLGSSLPLFLIFQFVFTLTLLRMGYVD